MPILPRAPGLPPGRNPAPGASRDQAGAATRASRERLIRALVLVLLAAATCAAFAGVLRAGWIHLDDPDYVAAQPRVAHGLRLDSALWFLSHPHSANWHPLTSWSHLLDVQLFGLNPAGHHATSLFLHVLNAVLLALVLSRLTGAWWRSVAVAALFALHPLRVESVAWVSERKDVLSGLFFVLTLGAYGWWVERPGKSRYAVLMLALALGLMAKPMLVTLPFVLLLLDVWPLGRLALPGRGKAPRGSGAPPEGPGRARSGRSSRSPRARLSSRSSSSSGSAPWSPPRSCRPPIASPTPRSPTGGTSARPSGPTAWPCSIPTAPT